MELNDTITVDGRDVLVNLPTNYDLLDSVPIIVALHGLASKAEHMRDHTGLKEMAVDNGYILVCPNGQGNLIKSWNAGSCCGLDGPPPGDDTAFIKKTLNKVKDKLPKMNNRKVFLVGMSNGAMLAHMLAHKLKSTLYKVSAIASVSGTMAFDPALLDEKYPVPIMHIHGSLDQVIPPNGSLLPGRKCKSVEATIRIWRKRNKSKADADVITQTIANPGVDNTVVLVKTYPSSLPGNYPVVNISINNAGHTWPGHDNPPDLDAALQALGFDLGAISRQIKTEEIVLTFFQQFS